jgi:hypothetical protein
MKVKNDQKMKCARKGGIIRSKISELIEARVFQNKNISGPRETSGEERYM